MCLAHYEHLCDCTISSSHMKSKYQKCPINLSASSWVVESIRKSWMSSKRHHKMWIQICPDASVELRANCNHTDRLAVMLPVLNFKILILFTQMSKVFLFTFILLFTFSEQFFKEKNLKAKVKAGLLFLLSCWSWQKYWLFYTST